MTGAAPEALGRLSRAIGRGVLLAMSLAALLASAGCAKAPEKAPQAVAQIAWREGDVDDAFAEAREQNKPVLLYWGASWCPPCNLMKQTLFKDPAFIAETRAFIPVHLDGDAKGAQAWGEKFGISGYPTVIVLRPDRAEVTRLAGGATAATLAQVLRLTARRAGTTEDLLKRAANPAALSGDDWRLLANFDWLDDPRHFGDEKQTTAVLDRLARAAPDPGISRHLELTGLALLDPETAKLSAAQLASLRSALPEVLVNPAEMIANRQELIYAVPDLLAQVPDASERKSLGARLIAALDRVAADPGVPLGDRLDTVRADIVLAKAGAKSHKVPPAVLTKVRARVAMADRAATDPQMRQAVMPDAGQLLAQAGDLAGARALLERELPHAVAPYYFMVDLAALAEQAKEPGAALVWYQRAAAAAQGPATRVQWAILYSRAVMRLTPADRPAVERSAAAVIDALGANTAGYAERASRQATKWSGELGKWSARHDGGAVLARLSARMAKACASGACRNVITV